MNKKRWKINWFRTILFLILLGCIEALCFSLYGIAKWKIDSKNTNDEIDNLNTFTEVTEINDSENTEIINSDEIDKSNPYWDYIKTPLINVDFDNLKSINSDVKGWIKVNGTNINYPFVQTNNNSYYLTHAFDKSYNSAGWVFMDYRNGLITENKNTILYAHGRINGTMFGTLKNILTNKWLDNSDNFIIKTSTEEENGLWQVFSVYRIPTTSDYLQTSFTSDEEFVSFANKLIDRSAYNFNTSVSKNDKIITLSTCYNDDDKMVMHAKLIKFSKK